MNKKHKKKLQKEYANTAVLDYFSHLNKTNLEDISKLYVKEIIKFQTSFNLKLSKEQKLSFCKKCYSYHPTFKTLQIRLNSKLKCIEYICTSCKSVKRFKYK